MSVLDPDSAFDEAPQDPQRAQTEPAVAAAARLAAARRGRARDATFETAVASPAPTAAKAFDLARRTGLPPADVEQDPTPAQQLAKRQALAMLRQRGKNPITARLMEDLWFAKTQQDDVDNLAETEGTFEWVGRHVRGGWRQNELGIRGLVEAFDDSPENQARLRELDADQARLEGGFIGGALTLTGQLAGTLPLPIAAGAVATPLTTPVGGIVAGGATAFTINSALAAGTAYHAMRRRGIPHEQAFAWSAVSGVGTGTLETLADLVGAKVFVKAGGKLLGKAAAEAVTEVTTKRARTQFVKDYLTVLGTEAATETAQEGLQWAAEQSAMKAAGFSTDEWSTLRERAADAFSQTLQSAALLAGLGPAANYFADVRRAEKANRTAEFLDRLGKQAQGNTGAAAAPTVYEAFLEQAGRQHGAETSYVNGEELATVLQQLDKAAATAGTRSATDTLEERVPGTKEELAEAVANGGDVALPTSKIVRTPLWEALRPHVRLNPDDVSFAQSERIRGEARKQAQQLAKNLDEEDQRLQVVLDEGAGIGRQVRDELAASGFNRRDAEQLAVVWRAIAEVTAERMGVTPAGFQQQAPLQIGTEPLPAGDELRQGARDRDRAQVNFEVAPDPDDVELSSRWNRLDAPARTAISTRVANAVLPGLMERMGVRGAITTQVGSYLEDTNPSFAIRLENGDPSRVAGVVGHAFAQQSMLVLHAEAFPGSFQANALRVEIGQQDPAAIDAIYRQLRTIEHDGRKLITGQTTVDGSMTILLDEKDDADVVGARVAEVLGDTYPVTGHALHAAFPEKAAYDYALPESDPAGDEGLARRWARDARAEASALLRTELDTAESGRAAGDVEQQRPERAAGDAERQGRVEPPGDAGELRSGARGRFNPKTWRMTLGEDADVDTVLHEFSHAVLTIYSDLAAQKVHPTIVEDMNRFLRWAGVKDLDTWRSMTLEQQRERHEQFADAFMSWLFEGKAPTPELQPLFSRFLRILKRIYEVLTGQAGREALDAAHQRDFGVPLLPLTDEMRGVFARILASDQQVRDTMAIRGAVPTFQTQKDAEAAGMSAADWIEHQRKRQEADDAAVDELTRANLADMRWLSGAKGRLLARLQKKEQDKREKIRAEVAPAIEAMPVHRARRWLQTGEYTDENGERAKTTDAPHKLRRDAVPEDKQNALRGLLAKDGVDPDVVAEEFGFKSGEALVRELALAPQTDRAIETAITQRMLRRHATLADPKQREAYIERILHSPARRRFVAAELSALEAAVGPPREARAVAREAARMAIATRTMSEVRGNAFARAARRASERSAEAMRGGDLQEAIASKRQHLFNEEMAALAIEAREEWSRAQDEWRRLWKADEDLAKERELGVVSAARAILEAHGEVSHLRSGTAYLELLRENDEELHAELDGIVRQATANAKPLRDLTLEQFRELRETVEFLWDRAKRDLEIEIGDRRIRRTEAVANLITQAEKTIGQAKDGPGVLRDADRRGLQNAGAVTLLKRVEHQLRMIDGGGRGAWTTILFEPLRQRFNGYMADRERLVQQLHDRLRKLTLDDAKIESRNDELGGHVFEGLKELLGALLHMGNLSNLQNMLAGNGWAERRSDRSVDTSGWWRFVNRMVAEGKIPTEHLQFLQFVWNMNQKELRPIAQQANRQLYGLYFQQIEATPFELAGQTWAGGYVPSAVDLDHPRARHIPEKQKLALIDDPQTRFRESMAHTGRGFAISRQKVDLPRLMDVRLQVQHLDDVLRYVHLQPAVRDVTSILRDRDFRGYANAVDPNLISGLLTPWLERTARNRIAKPGMNRQLDAFFAFLRRTTGLNFMFGSLRNAAQQITGLGNALAYVPRRDLVQASWDVLRDFGSGELRREITADSEFMRLRLDSKLGQMQDDIDAILDWSWRGAVKRFTNRHGYFLQSWVQDRVDQVVWLGARNHALEQAAGKMTDAEARVHAIAEADSAVRRSQGSQTPIDVAGYEASTPFVRLLTQFSGYFNVSLNQIIEARDHRVRATMRSLVVPALGSAVIAAVLSGGEEWDDEDGNGNTDEFAWWMFSTQVKAAAGLVPAFGPAAAKLVDDRPGDRLSLAPAAALYESAERLLGRVGIGVGRELEGKRQTATSATLTGTDLRDLATVLTAATGIPFAPLARPLSYLRDQDLGRIKPATGAFDYVRGLLTGQGDRVAR